LDDRGRGFIPHIADMGFTPLVAVDAIATDDVWAVGKANAQTLTMHWDGSTWTRVPRPNVGQDPQGLVDVSAVASDDVWAVGTIEAGEPFPGETLVLHWDGSVWSVVDSPSPPSGDEVTGVAAFPDAKAWMVGTYFPDAQTNKALTVRFAGENVHRIGIPGTNTLEGVAGTRPDNVWAVGTGIYRFRNHAWHLVVSP